MTEATMTKDEIMRYAIELSRREMRGGNAAPFAAVIVRDSDPSAHGAHGSDPGSSAGAVSGLRRLSGRHAVDPALSSAASATAEKGRIAIEQVVADIAAALTHEFGG